MSDDRPTEPTLPPVPAPSPTASLSPANAVLAPTIAPAGVAGPVTFVGTTAQLPGYDLLRERGRGGMGVVYQARQVALNRTVAVKMILAGAHAGEANLTRFLTEAEAVAQLQHPHIVQIFEIGRHDDLPYFTLEFVPGGSLADKVRDHPLPAREAAQMVEQLAKGVAYAHQRGIIHRDLKPENVLLAENGTPKITDFGLAKRVAVEPGAAAPGSGLTATGAVLGTPSYMAPEQAGGKPGDIGPAADIYALGAILYRLITGRPPFQAATPLDTILQVVSTDPVPPRQLAPTCPKDLETICLKCLQKESKKRYVGAGELAADLRHFLNGEPIVARPVGRLERTWKWVKRRPWVSALGALAVLFLVTGSAVSTYFALEANQRATELGESNEQLEKAQRDALNKAKLASSAKEDALNKAKLADQIRKLAARDKYLDRFPWARQLWLANDVAGVEKVLAGCPTELRHWEWHYLNRLVHPPGSTIPVQRRVRNLMFTLDGEKLLYGTEVHQQVGPVMLCNAATGKEEVLSPLGILFSALAIHPDGKSAAWPGNPEGNLGSPGVILRQLSGGKEKFVKLPPSFLPFSFQWISEKTLLAAGWSNAEKRFLVVDVLSGKELLRLPTDKVIGRIMLEAGNWMTLSPDGQWLALVASKTFAGEGRSPNPQAPVATDRESFTMEVQVWDLNSKKLQHSFAGGVNFKTTLAFGPNGRYLAWGQESRVMLWDLSRPGRPRELTGHRDAVNGLAFSHDGKTLASGSDDWSVKVWDVATGQEKLTLRGHSEPVNRIAFRPDGKQLASASLGLNGVTGAIRFWDLTQDLEVSTLLNPKGKGFAMFTALNPAVPRVALGWSIDADSVIVEILDIQKQGFVQKLKLSTKVASLWHAFSPDGRFLAMPVSRAIDLFDVATGKKLATLEMPGESGGTSPPILTFCPRDGKRLMAAWAAPHKGNDKWKIQLVVWEVPSGRTLGNFFIPAVGPKVVHPNNMFAVVTALVSDPAGEKLAIGLIITQRAVGDPTFQSEVHLINAATGSVLRSHSLESPLWAVAIDPQGKYLVAAGETSKDGQGKIWDLASGQEIATLSGHTKAIKALAFSPDGKRLVSAGDDRTLKLWEVPNGQELVTLRGHRLSIGAIGFTPDGHRIISASGLDNAFMRPGLPMSQVPAAEVKIWDATPRR
jgi:WD40 repeat protein